MKRSGILCSLGALAVTSLVPQIAPAADTVHWHYEGEEGPAHWGDLTPDFKTCSLGMQQSPIDLNRAVPAHIRALDIQYRPTPLRIINNGHTVQVNYAPGSILKIHGHTYEVAQFHFHTPSEHKVDGKSFPLEMHLCTKTARMNSWFSACFRGERREQCGT
jgi:carbonic anhydrase